MTNFGQDGKIKKLRKTEHITKSQKSFKKALTKALRCDIIKKSAARGMTLQEKTPENPVEKNSKKRLTKFGNCVTM